MNPAKTVDKALSLVTKTAGAVLKPITGAADAVVGAVPGTKSVKTLDTRTSGILGSVTSANTLGPVAGLGVGITGGHVLEKLSYEFDRSAFGYGAPAVDETMTPEQQQAAVAVWKGQNTNRLLLKIGLGLLGLGVASASKNGVVQYAGLGVTGIEAVHIAQKHLPTPALIK